MVDVLVKGWNIDGDKSYQVKQNIRPGAIDESAEKCSIGLHDHLRHIFCHYTSAGVCLQSLVESGIPHQVVESCLPNPFP